MKRRIISLLMALVMTLSLVPTAAWAEVLPEQQDAAQQTTAENGGQEDSKPSDSDEEPAANTAAPQSGESGAAVQTTGSVSYIGAGGTVQSCAQYTEITNTDNFQIGSGWYVVRDDATVTDWMTACGSPIHLILCDGATLTVNGPIQNWYDGTYELNVYLQSGGTGKLIAKYGMMLDKEGTINRMGTPMKLVNNAGKATSDLSDYFKISKCDHEGFTYAQKDAKSHEGTCAYCGTTLSGEHDFTWAYKDADTHTGACKVCGYVSTAKHDMGYTANLDGLTHKRVCEACDLKATDLPHSFSNNKCVNCGAKAAAEVGGTIYSSLPVALDAAADGDTVKLLANHVTDWDAVEAGDEPMAVVKTKITLDLNGKTVDYLTVGEVVPDEEGGILESTEGDLTIKDGGLGSVGTVSSLQLKKGKLSIEGGEIGAASDTMSFVCSDETGEVNIQGGVVWYFGCEGGMANITGGKVYQLSVEGGAVTVSGGTNHGGWNDGTNYDSSTWSVNGGTLNITGGTFGKVRFNYTGGNVAICGGIFQSISNNGASASAPVMSLLADGYAFFGKDGDDRYTVLQDGSARQLENVKVLAHTHDIENGKCACGMAFVASVKNGENVSYYTTLEDAFQKADDFSTVTLLTDVQLVSPLYIVAGEQNGYANYFTLDLNGKKISYTGDGNTVSVSVTLTICDSSEGKTGAITGGETYAVMSGWNGTLTITGGNFGTVFIRDGDEISGGTFSEIWVYDFVSTNPESLSTVLKDGYAFANRDGSIVNGYENTNAKNVTVVEHKTHTYEATGKCACGKPCEHTLGEDGTCTSCGARFVAQVGGVYYTTVTEALSVAGSNAAVTLLTDITENVTFDGGEKSVTLNMDGHTLAAKDNSASALTVSSGTLTFADDATISNLKTDDPFATLQPAIAISGGKLVFTGDLTAQGGAYIGNGAPKKQEPAVYATGGELDFRGDLNLEGSLTVTGDAKLTNGLTKGTFCAVAEKRLSVEGSNNYKHVEALLADGYVFVDKNDASKYPCANASYAYWTGDVTVVAHEHTWGPAGELYECTACGKSCGHPDHYPSGKCPVCGKPCPHGIADQSPNDHNYYCNDCHQQMFARIQTDKYEWEHFTNLKDALAAAEDGQTVVLLGEVNNDNQYAILTGDNKTVTLDLNGKTVTGGWIQVGIDRNWNDQTSSRLNITGSGSLMTSGNLSVGYKATLDLSGWGGGENDKISNVGMSKNGNVNPNLESMLIVSENAGTIGTLGFYSWPSAGVKTKLNGGSYGKISIVVQYNSEPYGSLLAPGYAFQYIGTDNFVEYTKTATNQGNTIYNVKVVKCPHTSVTNGTCDYCGKTGIVALVNGTIYDNFANAQTAWLAEGGTLKLCKSINDMTTTAWKGDSGKTYTLDLNGYQITAPDDDSGSTTLPYQITVAGMKLSVQDTSESANGQLDNLLLSAGSSLTLKSGWLGMLTVPNDTSVKVSLQGGGLKGYNIRVPLAYVLSDGYYLFNTVSGMALSFDATPGSSNSTFTVKRALTTIGGEKTGTMPYGRNKLPFAPTAAWTASEAGTPTSITAIWYEWNGKTRTRLASAEMTVSGTGCTYGGTETDINEDAFAKMTVGSTHDLYVELRVVTGDISWYAASTGYQLTIGKGDLSDAEITFPGGNEKVFEPYGGSNDSAPQFTVTHNGKALERDVDYTVSGDTGSDVGTYQLTIKAAENSNYTGSKSAEWKIRPHKAAPSIGDVIKAYDGTTALPESTAIKLVGADSGYSYFVGQPLPLAAGTHYKITNARYDSASASTEEKTISFTITLLDKGYVFADGSTEKDFTVKGSDTEKTFKINKADAPRVTNVPALTITNRLAKTYEMTLPDLPALTSPCEYGDVSYSVKGVDLPDGYYTDGASVSTDGKTLTLPILRNNVDTTGSIGTVTILAKSENYQDITITVNVSAENKLVPEGSPTLSTTTITYGQKIGDITISGTMKDGDKTVSGQFTWDAPETKPDAGKIQANWTFTPEDTDTYQVVNGAADITVNKADVNISQKPAAKKLTYTGSAQELVTAGTVSGGIMQYSLDENGTYTSTVPTATNAGDYTVWYKVEGDSNHNSTDPVKIQVTIAKADVTLTTVPAAADLTYNGQLQALVTAGAASSGTVMYSLSKEGTYTATVPTAANAGKYTVWYKVEGDNNHNGVAAVSIAAQIKPKDISQAVITLKSALTYNGKAQLPEITSVTVDSMTLNAETDYTAEAKNAISAGDYPLTLTGKGNFTGTADQKTFTIGKAAALTVTPIPVNVTNNHAAAYTVDLATALNGALPTGCHFGTVKFENLRVSGDTLGYCGSETAVNSQGILTLAVNQVNNNVEGQAATVTVTAVTGNYQDITLTVVLNAVNKTVPTGAPNLSKATLAYNETLSAIRLSGTMRDGSTVVRGTFAWTEPDLRPASGTYIATWVFTPEDDGKYASVTGTVDITVTPPPETVPVYKVGGTVTEYSVTDPTHKQSIQGAVVTIRKGQEILNGQKVTDENGKFQLDGVVAGVYNVVVEYQGKIVTTKVELTTQNIDDLTVSIPREDVNSELAVGSGLTHDTVVGGLDEEAKRQFTSGSSDPDGTSVSVGMTIQEKPADAADEAQKAIREKATGKSLDFMDLNLLLTKNGSQTTLTETGTVLEIIISYDTSRQGITVVRHHVDSGNVESVTVFTQNDTKADGTFYIDAANKCIHIFASRFSTYAIGYTPASSGGSGGSSGGSGAKKDDVKSAETGDIGLLPYAGLALSACAGVAVLRHRRKRED